jgi:hypothetical protein
MGSQPRKRKEKPEFFDDGRVIANMNVDGMPRAPFRRKAFDEFGTVPPEQAESRLSRQEHRAAVRAVIFSYLLFGLAFFGGLALIILFCVYVWFR